jgi:hypothetical protein
MTKTEFEKLFERALNVAAAKAEAEFGTSVARSFQIELHASGYEGRVVSCDEALDQIFLGNDSFYKIIDIAIKELRPGESVAFVRVSGHPAVPLDQTYDPSGLGPFKPLTASRIIDQRKG